MLKLNFAELEPHTPAANAADSSGDESRMSCPMTTAEESGLISKAKAAPFTFGAIFLKENPSGRIRIRKSMRNLSWR